MIVPGTGLIKVGSTIKGVGVAVAVFVGVGVGVLVGVGVGVLVGVGVGVPVGVLVGVGVGVSVGVGTITATGIGVGSRVGIGIEVGVTSCDSNGRLRTTLTTSSSIAPSMAATPQLLSLGTFIRSLGARRGWPRNSSVISGCPESMLFSSCRSQYRGAGRPEARA